MRARPDWLDRWPPDPLPERGNEEIDGHGLVHIGQALEPYVKVLEATRGLSSQCESPIEVELGAYIKRDLPASLDLIPQYPFNGYRMDFAILQKSGRAVLFIECDGQEFHSTDQQRMNDKAKNAAAAHARIPLLRFSGSNIFRHPQQCAKHAIDLVKGFA